MNKRVQKAKRKLQKVLLKSHRCEKGSCPVCSLPIQEAMERVRNAEPSLKEIANQDKTQEEKFMDKRNRYEKRIRKEAFLWD